MAGTSLEALEPWRCAHCYFCRCESTRTLNCVDYPFCKSELPRGLIPYLLHSDPYVSLPLIHAGRVKCCDPATMRNRSAIFTSRSEELMTHFGKWEFWLTLLRSAQDGANRKQRSRNQPTFLTILSLHLHNMSLQLFHYCLGIKITIWEFVNSNDELHYKRRHLLKEQKSTSKDFRVRNLSFLWLKKQKCW